MTDQEKLERIRAKVNEWRYFGGTHPSVVALIELLTDILDDVDPSMRAVADRLSQ